MQGILGKKCSKIHSRALQTPETYFPATEARFGHGVRAACGHGLPGAWKPVLDEDLKDPLNAWQGIGQKSKKMDMLNGRTNQVVRRWSPQGDMNKPIMSKY